MLTWEDKLIWLDGNFVSNKVCGYWSWNIQYRHKDLLLTIIFNTVQQKDQELLTLKWKKNNQIYYRKLTTEEIVYQPSKLPLQRDAIQKYIFFMCYI